MNKMRLMLNMLAVSVICFACSSMGQAQTTRTWVSGLGDDANPCSRAAPCRTFEGAISKTAAGGEISVLDPGDYGAVTITKSITINGGGTLAATDGIIIKAEVNDVVKLRGLSINGQGSGLDGIKYLAGKRVLVEDCMIYDFKQKAIDVSHSGAGRMDVINTTIVNAADGISLQSGNPMNVSLFNVRINGTTNAGINALVGLVTVSDSMITNNTSFGAIAQGGTISLERTMIAHNGTGVSTNVAGANINLSNTTIIHNTAGITITAGTVRSFLNNRIAPGQGAPTKTTVQQ